MIDDASLNIDVNRPITSGGITQDGIFVGRYREISEGAEITGIASVTSTFAAASNDVFLQFALYWSHYATQAEVAAEVAAGAAYQIALSPRYRRDLLTSGFKFSARLGPIISTFQDGLLSYVQRPTGEIYNGSTLAALKGYIWGHWIVSGGSFTAGSATLGLNIGAVHGTEVKSYRSGFTV